MLKSFSTFVDVRKKKHNDVELFCIGNFNFLDSCLDEKKLVSQANEQMNIDREIMFPSSVHVRVCTPSVLLNITSQRCYTSACILLGKWCERSRDNVILTTTIIHSGKKPEVASIEYSTQFAGMFLPRIYARWRGLEKGCPRNITSRGQTRVFTHYQQMLSIVVVSQARSALCHSPLPFPNRLRAISFNAPFF